MSVSLDDRRTCLGVHWDVPPSVARRQFAKWGFHGIDGFKKNAVLNGNEARTAVRDEAIRRDATYFWVGDYDWGVGQDSAVYEFTFSLYTGPDGRLFDGAKQEKER